MPETDRYLISRRRFMGLSAALTGSLVADAAFGGPLAALAADKASSVVSGGAWRQLEKMLAGQLIRPGERGFAELAMPNNLRYRLIRPGSIALCKDAADIAACVRWRTRHAIPLIVRGGGHFYAGYSSTEGLMINLLPINSAQFDTAHETVTIGGAIRNGAVYAALKQAGRSITHGRCPTVGAGGKGYDMRHNGIAVWVSAACPS